MLQPEREAGLGRSASLMRRSSQVPTGWRNGQRGWLPDGAILEGLARQPAGGEKLTYFKDPQEVYDTIGKLFVDLADDEELAPKFRKANTIVRYEFSDPDTTITVRLQEGQPGDVDFGESDMEPDVTMSMEADTAHRFWLGKVNVTVAMARGQIKAKGPVAKILKLVPLTKPVFPRYKAQLESQGREDLVNV
jgi:putative sterol carrier protein